MERDNAIPLKMEKKKQWKNKVDSLRLEEKLSNCKKASVTGIYGTEDGSLDRVKTGLEMRPEGLETCNFLSRTDNI